MPRIAPKRAVQATTYSAAYRDPSLQRKPRESYPDDKLRRQERFLSKPPLLGNREKTPKPGVPGVKPPRALITARLPVSESAPALYGGWGSGGGGWGSGGGGRGFGPVLEQTGRRIYGCKEEESQRLPSLFPPHAPLTNIRWDSSHFHRVRLPPIKTFVINPEFVSETGPLRRK